MNTTTFFAWLGQLLAPVKAWILGTTICTSNLNGVVLVMLGAALGIAGFIFCYFVLHLLLVKSDATNNEPRRRPGLD